MALFVNSGSVVIGQTTSNAIFLNENVTPVAITTGSDITATTLTFLVSNDGVNYNSLYDDTSTEVSITVTSAARSYRLNPLNFWPFNSLKVREGTSASAVAQKTSNAPSKLVAKTL